MCTCFEAFYWNTTYVYDNINLANFIIIILLIINQLFTLCLYYIIDLLLLPPFLLTWLLLFIFILLFFFIGLFIDRGQKKKNIATITIIIIIIDIIGFFSLFLSPSIFILNFDWLKGVWTHTILILILYVQFMAENFLLFFYSCFVALVCVCVCLLFYSRFTSIIHSFYYEYIYINEWRWMMIDVSSTDPRLFFFLSLCRKQKTKFLK